MFLRSLRSSSRSESFCFASSSAATSLRSTTLTIAAPLSVTTGSLTPPCGQRERGRFERRADAGVAHRRAARDELGGLDLEPGRLGGLFEVARLHRRVDRGGLLPRAASTAFCFRTSSRTLVFTSSSFGT